MPPKKASWNVQRDHMLFVLLVESISVNWNDVAKKWAEKYPDDESAPTGSAISQHIAKLKKGNSPNSGLGAAKSTPIKSTPSAKRPAPKTTSSSAKRSRPSRMSEDDDDTDDKKNISFDTIGKRETPGRRSSARRQSYREDGDEGDTSEAPNEATPRQARAPPTQGVAGGDELETPLPVPRDSAQPQTQADDIGDLFGGPWKETKARSKSNPPKFDYFSAEESEEDTYAPML